MLSVGDCSGVSKSNSGLYVVGGMEKAAGVLSKAEKSQTSTGAAVGANKLWLGALVALGASSSADDTLFRVVLVSGIA